MYAQVILAFTLATFVSNFIDVDIEEVAEKPKPVYVYTVPQKKLKYLDNVQIDCLARNVYFEARGESFVEQVAVAMVTRNRLLLQRYGKTWCEVVYANKQFSWTEDIKNVKDISSWKKAREIAYHVYTKKMKYDPTKGATHFYSVKVFEGKPLPRWAVSSSFEETLRLDGHAYGKMDYEYASR